jgi:UrcA family protein
MFGLAGPAAGGVPQLDTEHRTVRSAGLDITRLPDAEALYARIRTAAQSACRAQRALWDVKQVLHKRRCVERAVEDAIVRADQPLLTAVHRRAGERVAER